MYEVLCWLLLGDCRCPLEMVIECHRHPFKATMQKLYRASRPRLPRNAHREKWDDVRQVRVLNSKWWDQILLKFETSNDWTSQTQTIHLYESVWDRKTDCVEFSGRSNLLVVANWPHGGGNCHCNVGSPGQQNVSTMVLADQFPITTLVAEYGSWKDVSEQTPGHMFVEHIWTSSNSVLLHLFCRFAFGDLLHSFVARFEEEALCALLQLAGRPLTFRALP